jgi:hypothetical protein
MDSQYLKLKLNLGIRLLFGQQFSYLHWRLYNFFTHSYDENLEYIPTTKESLIYKSLKYGDTFTDGAKSA